MTLLLLNDYAGLQLVTRVPRCDARREHTLRGRIPDGPTRPANSRYQNEKSGARNSKGPSARGLSADRKH